MAVVTERLRQTPSEASIASGEICATLSRIGRSVFLRAQWKIRKKDSMKCIRLRSPLSGTMHELRVVDETSSTTVVIDDQTLSLASCCVVQFVLPMCDAKMTRELTPPSTLWRTSEHLAAVCDSVMRTSLTSVVVVASSPIMSSRTLLLQLLRELPVRSSDAVRYVSVSRILEASSAQTTSPAMLLQVAVTPESNSLDDLTVVVLDQVSLLSSESLSGTISVHSLADMLESVCQRRTPGRLLVLSLVERPSDVPSILMSPRRLCQSVVSLCCVDDSVAVGASAVQPPQHTSTHPSSARESWGTHLVGLEDTIQRIDQLLVQPLRISRELHSVGIEVPKGALIVGPSGSGKTALLAALHAALKENRDVSVFMVDSLTLIEKEVGASEKRIHQLLARARASAPSVLFLDNLDALAPPRGKTDFETNMTSDRTLSTLLVELDGVKEQRAVVVIASAPSVAALDPAMVRPGRLDLHFNLTLPSPMVLCGLIWDRLVEMRVVREDAGEVERAELMSVIQTSSRSLTFADGMAAVRSVMGDVLEREATSATSCGAMLWHEVLGRIRFCLAGP
jgi:energy-coupling factor transporter ATP-binding protein EcfA2